MDYRLILQRAFRGPSRANRIAAGLAALVLLAPGVVSRGQETTEGTAKKTFYLPKNPVAAAYMLGRLSNEELIQAPRSEFVYVAMLQRQGLDRKYRLEALQGLAELRKTDRLTELLRGLEELDQKEGASTAVQEDLGVILLAQRREDLQGKREVLEKLASESTGALTRQIGYAALLTSDLSPEAAWNLAESHQHLEDLVLGVPIVRDEAIRTGLYGKVEPLLEQNDRPELRRAAIRVISTLPAHEQEAFRKLASLIAGGVEREAAIASLQKIPRKSWPGDDAAALVQPVLGFLKSVPAAERTTPEYLEALQLGADLAALLSADDAREVTRAINELGVKVIVIRTVYEQMLFDKQLVAVEVGKPVEIVFENDDVMPHNMVVVAPGAVEEIGLAAEKMRPEPDAQGKLYIPDSPKVLHSTRLLQPGEKARLSFTAPAQPGEYPYVCTYPGHWRRMTGTLAVVKDVDAFLAERAAQAPEITDWKVEDFAADLAAADQRGNVESGRSLFTSLACVQCHRLGQEGYAFGPDLKESLRQLNHNRQELLRQILEPSKTIADRYRNYQFELEDGETITGMILEEGADFLVIQAGPSDTLIQKIPKSRIRGRKAQEVSAMPAGLLGMASKEQVLDLLAFLESGGTGPVVQHHHH